jgi:hypothetical protein
MARNACGGEERSMQGSVGNLQGKSPRGRHRLRWYFNIKMNLAINMMGAWTGLVWLKSCTREHGEDLPVIYNVLKFLTS